MFTLVKLLSAIILCLFIANFSELKADPLRITSGSIYPQSTDRTNSTATSWVPLSLRILFAGDDFTVAGGNGGERPLGAVEACSFNCLEGDTFSPNSTITTGTIKTAGAGSGTFTYLGAEYKILQGIFTFTGETLSLPQYNGDLGSAALDKYLVPFEMTGSLLLRPLSTTAPDLTVSLYGSGNADITYVPYDGSFNTAPGTRFLGRIRYDFTSPTPEPVPEPATLFLLGTGLAGIAGYRVRRRKTNK